jgi:hypothetical protein
MLKRLTILGSMLLSILVAGSAATPASAQPVNGSYHDFTWDSRYTSILEFQVGGVPVTTSEYFCGLVKIWGEFLSFDDYLVLASHEWPGQVAGGQWYLSGSRVRPISATARCVRLENFSAFTGCFGGGSCMRFQDFGENRANFWHWMWWSDAISTLNGMGGAFDGGGEIVGVYPWNDPGSATGVTFYAEATSGAVYRTRMWSRSTFLGSRSFYAGRYETAAGYWAGGPDIVATGTPMGDVNQKFCYLAAVAGKFRGAGEWVEIRPWYDSRNGITTWRFYANTGANLGLRAEAECIWY